MCDHYDWYFKPDEPTPIGTENFDLPPKGIWNGVGKLKEIRSFSDNSKYELKDEYKYYTPSIEDIKIGYEYENFLAPSLHELEKSEWVKNVAKDHDLNFICYTIRDSPKFIRTPFLTKEQIESEGWVDMQDRGMSENNGYLFEKGACILKYWTAYKRIRIEHMQLGTILETGIIDKISINEFRYLTNRLLKID